MSVYLRMAKTPKSDNDAAMGAPTACWVEMGFRVSCYGKWNRLTVFSLSVRWRHMKSTNKTLSLHL